MVFYNFSLKSSKIIQKSCQNHPKSFPNHPQIIPKPSQTTPKPPHQGGPSRPPDPPKPGTHLRSLPFKVSPERFPLGFADMCCRVPPAPVFYHTLLPPLFFHAFCIGLVSLLHRILQMPAFPKVFIDFHRIPESFLRIPIDFHRFSYIFIDFR